MKIGKKNWFFYVMLILVMFCKIQVSAKTVLPADVTQASQGCTLLGIEGSYIVQTQEALDRINAIRLEACREGVLNPSTGRKLTTGDYIPIKWSSGLEYIARLRAAESSLTMDHVRTNGKICFALTSPTGVQSWGEVLAWNGSRTMLQGIEQWYEEKEDWVRQNPNAVTGHYEQMIDPSNRYVGLATFCSEDGRYYNTTAGEFSFQSGLDETRGTAVENCIQTLEVNNSYLKGTLAITGSNNGIHGAVSELNLKMATSLNGDGLLVLGPVTWTSSAPEKVSVDAKGTVRALSCGTAVITARDSDNHTGSFTYTVNHDWDGGKVTKEATLTQTGVMTYTCRGCGAVKTKSLPKIKLSKGQTYIVGEMKYKITSARKDGKGTVALVGTTKSIETLTSLKIASAIRLGDIKFQVTEVGEKALKGYYNLKTVTIGSGVTVIGKEAFRQCTNLKTITVKSKKLRTVGKNAIYGIYTKAAVKVPASKVNAYKKLFKSSTGFRKTMKLKK